MRILLRIRFAVIALFLVGLMGACDDFKDHSPDILDEGIKDPSGSWRIVKASRNGVDITSDFDFTRFRLNINADGSYSIDNYIPFLVRENGTWETDDSQYPFKINFTEGNGPAIESTLNYPIVGEGRQIRLTFRPGCYMNSYTYEFERVSN